MSNSESAAELKQAREEFSESLFTALARMERYLRVWRIEPLNHEKVVATALSLASAATEMDLRLRAMIRVHSPSEDRSRCYSYSRFISQGLVANGGTLLKHLLECSACYEKCAALRVEQRMPPVAQDLLWMMMLQYQDDAESAFSLWRRFAQDGSNLRQSGRTKSQDCQAAPDYR